MPVKLEWNQSHTFGGNTNWQKPLRNQVGKAYQETEMFKIFISIQ